MILLVTREIAARSISGFKDIKISGHSSIAGPHTRFTEFCVPGRNILVACGKGAANMAESFT